MAGVEPLIKQLPNGWNEDTRAYVITSNRHRKQRTPAQIVQDAYEDVETEHGGARRGIDGRHLKTVAEAAADWGINVKQLRTYADVMKAEPRPGIVDAIRNGTIKTVGHAFSIVTPNDDEKRDGLTSNSKQRKWLADPRSIKWKPRQSKQARSIGEITASQLKATSEEQLLALFRREMPQLNRAAAREGTQFVEQPVSSDSNRHLKTSSPVSSAQSRALENQVTSFKRASERR